MSTTYWNLTKSDIGFPKVCAIQEANRHMPAHFLCLILYAINRRGNMVKHSASLCANLPTRLRNPKVRSNVMNWWMQSTYTLVTLLRARDRWLEERGFSSTTWSEQYFFYEGVPGVGNGRGEGKDCDWYVCSSFVLVWVGHLYKIVKTLGHGVCWKRRKSSGVVT